MDHLLPACATLLLVVSPCTQQGKDLRDVVSRKKGPEVRGRVLNPWSGDELVVLQGGKRVRVPRRDVTAMATVTDRLRELFAKRDGLGGDPRRRLMLAEWAGSKELPEMARLLAMDILFDHADFAAAHEFLGHRKGKRGWQWLHDGDLMTLDKWEKSIEKWGKALQLSSEHWNYRANGGVRQAVRALLDLERLYLWWVDTFGKRLELKEVVRRMDIHAWRSIERFPRWGQRARPYFVPRPHSDAARTFYPALDPQRPEQLFFLGTQHLIYKSLADDPQMNNERDRICAWLEVGFGRYAERVMQGPAGQVRPVPWTALDIEMMSGMAWGEDVTNLIHMPMYASFYLRKGLQTEANWGAALSFFAYFMEHLDKPVRIGFDHYLVEALGRGRGDSSRAFDKALSRPVEDFAKGWRAWTASLAR